VSAVKSALEGRGGFDPLATVSLARRQMGVRRTLTWAVRGLLAGGLAAALVFVAALLMPFPAAATLAAAALLAGLAAGIATGIRHWPHGREAARAVDRRFALHDRLTTALELRASDRPLAAIQRADTERRLAGLAIHETARAELRWREMGVTALVLALALALAGAVQGRGSSARSASGPTAYEPAAGQGYSQASPGERQRIQRAAQTQIPAIARAAVHGLAPAARHDAPIHRLNQALQRLRLALQQATSQAGALRALSATQQDLRRIGASLHAIAPSAVSQLDRALFSPSLERRLAGLGGPQSHARNGRPGGQGLQGYQSTAAQMNRLADQIASLTATRHAGQQGGKTATSRLAAIKFALARAANTVSDRALRSALQRAASSLGSNDSHSAIHALQQAASALNRSPAARQAQGALGGAASAMDAVKDDITGLGKAGSASASTNAAPPGLGQPTGTGAGTGSVNGVNGRPDRNGATGHSGGSGATTAGRRVKPVGPPGKGLGPGRGPGSGSSGRRGNGGHGGLGGKPGTGGRETRSGQGSSPGNGQGPAGHHGPAGRNGAQVYVPPVKVNASAGTIQSRGPNGVPLPGSTVPYHQVFGRYQQVARAALDQASLPPSVRSYVRRYFSAISR
jgi:hypothetical protein